MDIKIILAVFTGGGFGSLLRFGLSAWIRSRYEEINPEATFTANLLATALLATIVYLVGVRYEVPDLWRKFLVTGLCGGFSTFSTFSYETFWLMQRGYIGWAVGNVVVSIALALCVLFVLSMWSK